MLSPQRMGTFGREASRPARQHHTGPGAESRCCQALSAGPAPSAALIGEIVSQTEQASVCPWPTYPPHPGSPAGGENPHEPESMAGKGRPRLPARTGAPKPVFLPGYQTFKGQDVPRLVMDQLGQALGSVPRTSCFAPGARERPARRPLCQP